ncbi:MAG TPA: protein-glutamate O-methyltransferase CheR [Hungateiclostridium thermocellum]|uniref:MCP methyltransferase, CheR-type n=2 Tax=Acetivibrio thermocellus TaxID=1515 RepID=A3DC48_ACET2|nr:protein-glutamate O-methyltransferase CheR [Acetivibrio thermocellus]ANV76705.1 MCP methyltransferase, CheR-type [Acetivibrio thermocellus DSM 2360]CDG34966.1 CheR-type MCP methyltransferase [Acetivibrio thermocellus BC1]ABN51527.1 MCP methyltransferase, CheR-type [Acetivibrio thermocellus ATCC 27405]ADU74988.1 MCP methyltransferase, CheR-type [Acetivibrio thermocellus DSM 1313]ALX08955.1 MCP methyltransferase, CheR-type [Acetivibrio thermocellus AD2]
MHISVMGELDSKADVDRLLESIDENCDCEIHLTFLDANVVPREIVEKIVKLKEHNKCKIFVLKAYLYSYFLSLGISCFLVKKKSILNKDFESKEKLSSQTFEPEKVEKFLWDIYDKYGFDFTEYRKDSIIRRIKISMLRYCMTNFDEFSHLALTDQDVFEQLFLDFSINTTNFFRDPEVFMFLREKVLLFLDSYSHIRIWCVGCSNGKEPYSLAIILKELGMLHKVQIYATDINPYVIEEAKNGLYSVSTINTDIANYKKSGGSKNFTDYFEVNGNYMKVKDDFKDNILFFQHSVIEKGILNEFQMILCRNVMIYFDIPLQKKVLRHFYNSLDSGGFLVMGKSEGMLLNNGYEYFADYNEKYSVYRRKH